MEACEKVDDLRYSGRLLDEDAELEPEGDMRGRAEKRSDDELDMLVDGEVNSEDRLREVTMSRDRRLVMDS